MIRKHDVVTLVAEKNTKTSFGEYSVSEELTIDIPCMVKSVTQSEWAQAMTVGFMPQYCLVINEANYSDEKIAVFQGKRYSVYRTYARNDNMVELYLKAKAGVVLS